MDQAHTESLALFSNPLINSGIERKYYTSYRSTNQTDISNPVEFYIPGNTSDYVDLAATHLRLKLKITKLDGSSLTAEDYVVPVNMPIHAIWSNVEVFLNETMVSSSGTMYAHKAYIDTLLMQKSKEKEISGEQMFDFDEYGPLMLEYPKNTAKDPEPKLKMSEAMKERRKWSLLSAAFDVEGPLLADICKQMRLVLNGVPIRIKLYPNRMPFMLLAPGTKGNNLKLNLLEAQLLVCKVSLHPAVLLAHEASLREGNKVLYPYHRTETRLYTVPKGQFSQCLDNLFSGEIPSVLYIALVSELAYNGNYELSPFKFHHYHVNFLNVTVDNIPLPSQNLSPNFENDLYVDCFTALKRAIHYHEIGTPGIINKNMFKQGYALFAFDLGTKLDRESSLFTAKKRGQLRINIKFAQALPEGVNIILLARFPDLVQIDASRNVLKG